MLMASHLAGVGQASGTGVGLVHALGHAIGTRGKVAHGTALATVLPEVLASTSGTRDRELALVGIALGVASPPRRSRPRRRARHRRHRQLAARRRPATDAAPLGLPTTRRIDQLVTDDASTTRRSATRRACRPPAEARAILGLGQPG